MHRSDKDDELEAKRILDRVARESASSELTGLSRGSARAWPHVAAKDDEADDWIELWGTRIGRVLGPLIMAGLLVYLLMQVFGG